MILDPFRHQHAPSGAIALPLFAGRTTRIRAYTLVDADTPDEIRGTPWNLAPAGRGGYAVHSVYSNGYTTTLRMHRIVLDAPPEMDVDHKNRDSLDNRRANLRLATASQNGHNSGIRSTNRTGFRGVHPTGKNRFSARIHVGGKRVDLGIFNTLEEAALAYNEAAMYHLGEFAFINPISVESVA